MSWFNHKTINKIIIWFLMSFFFLLFSYMYNWLTIWRGNWNFFQKALFYFHIINISFQKGKKKLFVLIASRLLFDRVVLLSFSCKVLVQFMRVLNFLKKWGICKLWYGVVITNQMNVMFELSCYWSRRMSAWVYIFCCSLWGGIHVLVWDMNHEHMCLPIIHLYLACLI